MPLLPATDPPRKRRASVWLLVFAVAVLPLVGLFAWSCYQPILLGRQGHGIGFGRSVDDPQPHSTHHGPGYVWHSGPGFGWWAGKLPGGAATGWYGVSWAGL